MKLTDYCIEQKALDIYQRSIKDSRIDEDLCSDIYLLFIKRMKSYRLRHPDVEDVDPGFVTNAVKFIIRDLRKKEKHRKDREEILETIHQGLLASSKAMEYEQDKRDMQNKIFQFIKESRNNCQVINEYALWFFMFYSVYFPMAYLEKIVIYLGYHFESLESILIRLRELAIQNGAKRIEKADYKLGEIFNKIISCHIKMKNEDNEELISTMNKACNSLHIEQEETLENLTSIKIIPFYNEAASIIGVHHERFYYGINSFCNKLNNWVNHKQKHKKVA